MQVSRFVVAATFGLLAGASTIASAQGARADRAERQAAQGVRRGDGGPFGKALLRGITLSPTQQAQVDSLQRTFAAERKAKFDTARGSAAQGQPARRARPDSAARAAMVTERRAEMERMTAELRGLLTAEQRVTLDANVASLKERARAGARAGARDGVRDGARGAGRGLRGDARRGR